MFKIGEFSKITQVSVRMLRYYDENNLLKPAAIDSITGYRQYLAGQIDDLNRIVFLRDMGFGVKEIREMVQNPDTDKIKKYLEAQLQKTRDTIRDEEEKQLRLQGYLKEMNTPAVRPDISIVMKPISSCHVISLRRRVENYYCEGELWQEMSQYLRGCEENQSFSIYHDLDYRETDVDIEICVAIPEDFNVPNGLVYRQIPQVERAACFMVPGDYSHISPAYREFAYWLEQHPEYRMSGENRQICHVTACHTNNPEEYVTELQIPLTLTPCQPLG